MASEKRGQIEITFNWVYVLIAGVVIILFFVAIAVKQKTSSEKQLSSDIVRVMESIFTSAGVSEKTKNVIETSGLADYTLYFDCQDSVGKYGIKDSGIITENAVNPVFSPRELKSSKLILWSLPYKFPFKVTDFLFVTSANTQYYLFGRGGSFADEFAEATGEFNVKQITAAEQIEPGKNFQVRILDLDGKIQERANIPSSLAVFDDDKVTAVSFISGSTNMVNYFQKQDNVWIKTNRFPIQIISLGGENDAAKYAAIFSADGSAYQCNMQKAFRRLQYVIDIYRGRAQKLYDYYQALQQSGSNVGICLGLLRDFQDNLDGALEQFNSRTSACLNDNNLCPNLPQLALSIRNINRNLEKECVAVY